MRFHGSLDCCTRAKENFPVLLCMRRRLRLGKVSEPFASESGAGTVYSWLIGMD